MKVIYLVGMGKKRHEGLWGLSTGAALVDGIRFVATGRYRQLQDSAAKMHVEINCLYNASHDRGRDSEGRRCTPL